MSSNCSLGRLYSKSMSVTRRGRGNFFWNMMAVWKTTTFPKVERIEIGPLQSLLKERFLRCPAITDSTIVVMFYDDFVDLSRPTPISGRQEKKPKRPFSER